MGHDETAPAMSQGKASSSTAGRPVRTAPAPAPEPSPSKSYTPEQVEQVRNVRAAGKDYYKILGVPKNCDDAQLKKAYRKVSLGVCSISLLRHTGSPRCSHCSAVGCAAGREVASGQMVRTVAIVVRRLRIVERRSVPICRVLISGEWHRVTDCVVAACTVLLQELTRHSRVRHPLCIANSSYASADTPKSATCWPVAHAGMAPCVLHCVPLRVTAVGAAYACLSDAEQRQDYDRFGADGPQMARQRRGGGRAQYHNHGDIDPEDIFNMFFGMQPARGRTYVYQQQHGQQRRQQQQQYRTEANANYAQLLQLMPLLLLFLFSFLGNQAGRNDLPFRLQRTPPEFTFRRQTANSGTPYYVKVDFENIYNNRNKVR